MLAAAFPRAAWRQDSEAVYVMAIAHESIDPATARGAIADLIRNELDLPPVALVIRRCLEYSAKAAQREWSCPNCGSKLVAGVVNGPGLCFDCDWQGTFS